MSVRAEADEGPPIRENHPTLAEYTSREARCLIAQLCIKRIKKALGVDAVVSATGAVAEHLDVSIRTVQRWASGGYQGSDANIDELINLAYLVAPEEAAGILDEDLERHRLHVERVKARGGIPWTPGRRV